MIIKNISARAVTLKTAGGTIYTVPAYDETAVTDALWGDNEFRRWLRFRIRDIVVQSDTSGGSGGGVVVSGAPTSSPYIVTSADPTLTGAFLLSALVDRGLLSGRPSVTIPGRLWFVTDVGQERLQRSNGTTWDDLKISWSVITNSTHQSSHQYQGADPLIGDIDANARVSVASNGPLIGKRRRINFVDGTGISITSVDNALAEKVDVTISTLSIVPSGSIVQFAAGTAPGGWLICDGSAISRATYANLFGVIVTTYGLGDGSTTFNLPDLRGRVPVGYTNAGSTDVNALGKSDGTALANRTPRHYTANRADQSGTFAGYGNQMLAHQGTPALGDATIWTGRGLEPGQVQPTNAPIDTPAYLVLNYIIKT